MNCEVFGVSYVESELVWLQILKNIFIVPCIDWIAVQGKSNAVLLVGLCSNIDQLGFTRVKALGKEGNLTELVDSLYLSLWLREAKDAEYLTWKVGEMIILFTEICKGARMIYKTIQGICGRKEKRLRILL